MFVNYLTKLTDKLVRDTINYAEYRASLAACEVIDSHTNNNANRTVKIDLRSARDKSKLFNVLKNESYFRGTKYY